MFPRSRLIGKHALGSNVPAAGCGGGGVWRSRALPPDDAGKGAQPAGDYYSSTTFTPHAACSAAARIFPSMLDVRLCKHACPPPLTASLADCSTGRRSSGPFLRQPAQSPGDSSPVSKNTVLPRTTLEERYHQAPAISHVVLPSLGWCSSCWVRWRRDCITCEACRPGRTEGAARVVKRIPTSDTPKAEAAADLHMAKSNFQGKFESHEQPKPAPLLEACMLLEIRMTR